MKTETMSHDEWLSARRKGIGGSDVSALLGISPWAEPIDVYLDKIGMSEPKEDNAAMKRGRYLEPHVANMYRDITHRKVKRINKILTHKTRPYMLGNVDRIILGDDSGERSTGILEIKCPGVAGYQKIQHEGLPGTYIAQVQHYLAVTGYGWASICVFSAELWDMMYFDVLRDEKLIAEIESRCEDFWLNNVMKNVAPDGSGKPVEITTKMVGEFDGREDEWLNGKAELLVGLKKSFSLIEAEIEGHQNAVKEFMLSKELKGVVTNHARFSMVKRDGYLRLDEKLLLADGIKTDKYKSKTADSIYLKVTPCKKNIEKK